jgi:TDG/mug DNA glycosylase family protein
MKKPNPSRPKIRAADLQAAEGARLSDLVAPQLRVLFCGITPGRYSAATGHHFARPSNRFWRALYAAGFTERLLRPEEEQQLLASGYGLTNLVGRATAAASALSADELRAGAARLTSLVEQLQPAFVALLGISTYRVGFGRPEAQPGRQPERIGAAQVWVLPSPSGLNAHYPPAALAQAFRELREALETSER